MSTFQELFPPRSLPWEPHQMSDLEGLVFIVTGGNTGIGRLTVKHLLSKGGKVYMASRSQARAEQAIAALKQETGKAAIFIQLDLADLNRVRRFAKEFLAQETQLNVLFNNGGVMSSPMDDLTAQGYDLQFGTNVLGHHLLTQLLLPILICTTETNSAFGKSRIVTVSGSIYKMYPRVNYDALLDGPARGQLDPRKLYAQSKFGNVLVNNELARRYGDKVVAIAVHPGVIATEIDRSDKTNVFERMVVWLLMRPTEMGCINQLWAGTSPEGSQLNESRRRREALGLA